MFQDTLSSSDLINTINGNLTVELRNADTGRLEEKQETHNFISQSGIRYIKYVQRANYFKDQISTLTSSADTDFAPINPFANIVLTSSTKSPDSSNEGVFDGTLIGYGAKTVYTGADTLRGTPNVSLSQATNTYTKWVYDWATNAGNGTIGSVGWSYAGDTYIVSGTNDSRFATGCSIEDFKSTSVPTISRIARASGSQYYAIGGTNYTAVLTLDTNFTQTATFTPSAQFKASTALTGITWDYNNNKIWVLGVNTGNTPIMASYSTSGTLIDGPVTLPSRGYQDITFAGTNFWLIGSVVSTYQTGTYIAGGGTLYEISPTGTDVSNFTITFPKGYAYFNSNYTNYGEYPYTLAYESGSQRLYVASASFWTTGSYIYASSPDARDSTSNIRVYTTAGAEVCVPTNLSAWNRLTGIRGSLPAANSFTVGGIDLINANQVLMTAPGMGVYRVGLDGMGSRAKLSSTITKSNLQTLRITYRMDYT